MEHICNSNAIAHRCFLPSYRINILLQCRVGIQLFEMRNETKRSRDVVSCDVWASSSCVDGANLG
jgi:hypothetical protein